LLSFIQSSTTKHDYSAYHLHVFPYPLPTYSPADPPGLWGWVSTIISQNRPTLENMPTPSLTKSSCIGSLLLESKPTYVHVLFVHSRVTVPPKQVDGDNYIPGLWGWVSTWFEQRTCEGRGTVQGKPSYSCPGLTTVCFLACCKQLYICLWCHSCHHKMKAVKGLYQCYHTILIQFGECRKIWYVLGLDD